MFLDAGNLLSDKQFAYRAGRSTTDLAREVVWGVLSARESNRHVAVLCCDLSRAFDVADHSVIAAKLEHYGIRGPALHLLVDFMSNRVQTVVGEGGASRSREMGTDLGVPQGSSLSNIIFSLLMNDLPNSIPDAQVTMYADDVAATVTGSSVDDLERRLCLVAGQLAHWFQANGLALNPKKTQVMLFNLAGRRSRPLQVKVGSEDLFQVDTSCFLGFKVDCGLSWSDHIDWLCGRLGGACFALQRLAGTVPREVARSCYFATIQSLLTYGIELWGRAADWHRAFVMQKRAVRAMARIKSDESARQYFVSLEILTCPSLYILSVALFVRKNLHLYKECRGARRRGQLLDVQHRLARSEQSVYVCGPGIYNKLPTDIKSMQTLQGFKYKLKKWLATQAFYTVGEFIDRRSLNSSAWSHSGYLGGGTLIHPRVVLTAAHKVHGLKAEDMKCRAGEWDTLNTDEIYGHQEQNVAKIVRHPDFYYDSILNSVALLFLAAPFRQAPNVGLACLGPQLPPAGTVCYSSGWGKQKLGAKDSEIGGMLKKVELPLLSRSECQARLRKTRLSNYFTLHSSLMCAGGEEGKDTCAGDGGSPLVCHIGDPSHQRFALYGMVAYGIGCGEDGVPGVYVDAPHFHTWVQEKMREEGLNTESFMFIE